jgi:hypothetical protein
MSKKTVRLTESELKRIITESIKMVLTEDSDEEKYYKHLLSILLKDGKVEVSPYHRDGFLEYAKSQGVHPEGGPNNGNNRIYHIDMPNKITGDNTGARFEYLLKKLLKDRSVEVREKEAHQFVKYAYTKNINVEGAGTHNGFRMFYI